MANTYLPPRITVEYSFDHDAHVLMAHSHTHTAICGERIFRGEPWPVIRWASPTAEEAEQEAVKLRAYLADYAGGKRRDREPSVSVGADYWENL